MKKKLGLILAVVYALCSLSAVDVTLQDGKVYSGLINDTQNGVLTIKDGKVLIRIPAEEIKQVSDGQKDMTNEILQNALSPTKQDSHYLTREDYFIGETELGSQEWIRVGVAKMTKPASAATNNEAEFLSAQTGTSVWTKYYFKTRVAAKEELAVGTMVICLDTAENNIYRAPKNNNEARTAIWWASRITDNSEIFKGYVIVGGNYKVALDAVRIVVN